MAWITPKTDWTANDYYNADDLNRVENNTAEVAAYLASIHYQVPVITVILDRGNTDIDFISSINRVEGNIETLKNFFIAPPGYQAKKTWAVGIGFDYRDANRLENNLKLLYEWAQLAGMNQIFCGTFMCGEDGEIY
jgi:hypothetical protein